MKDRDTTKKCGFCVKSEHDEVESTKMKATEKKLIKLSDYVLGYDQRDYNDSGDFIDDVCKYAELIQQKPTLGMFVPCDEEGNVLREPEDWGSWNPEVPSYYDFELFNQYQAALGRVLFRGFYGTPNGYIQRRTETKLQRICFFDDEIVLYTFKLNGHWKSQKKIKTLEDLTEYELELKQ